MTVPRLRFVTNHDEKAPVERAVELIVYAPIGFAMFLRDLAPSLLEQFVERGRQQVENQLTQAKVVGQYAVAQGRERLQRQPQPVAPDIPPSRVEAAIDPTITAASGNGAPRGDASGLPIPDYDELSASQVVARLPGLTREELGSVRDYEEGQRQRKTILTRIEQLTA